MLQGTTPILEFKMNTSNIKTLEIAFGQNGKAVLEKSKDDCVLTENKITLTLSQQDTFILRACTPVQWQLRALDYNGIVVGTLIGELDLFPSLSKEVLE